MKDTHSHATFVEQHACSMTSVRVVDVLLHAFLHPPKGNQTNPNGRAHHNLFEDGSTFFERRTISIPKEGQAGSHAAFVLNQEVAKLH